MPALDLAGRVAAARGLSQLLWLTGGSAAMGLGIWSMHYVGMLAYTLPMEVLGDDWPTVVWSLLAAELASGIALFVASRNRLLPLRTVAGGVLMGLAIAAMHYIGMETMRLYRDVNTTARWAPNTCLYNLDWPCCCRFLRRVGCLTFRLAATNHPAAAARTQPRARWRWGPRFPSCKNNGDAKTPNGEFSPFPRFRGSDGADRRRVETLGTREFACFGRFAVN